MINAVLEVFFVPETPSAGITWPDYLVIVAYFAFVLAVGLYSSWKSNRDSVEGYFLSSRSMSFIPVRAIMIYYVLKFIFDRE